ncbi:MAG: PIN domain-containing protein [Cyanobacteria bacterium J06623_7]
MDTTTVSDYLRKNKAVVQHIHNIPPQEQAISTITKFEIAYGLANKPSLIKKYPFQLSELYQKTNNLVIDAKIADLAGQIRSELKKADTPIGVPDILIGATACFHNLTVVTINIKDFSKIERQLNIVDWKIENRDFD